jgi:hypothetical protein
MRAAQRRHKDRIWPGSSLDQDFVANILGHFQSFAVTVGERLADVAAKIDASVKDRETQIQDWKSKAEAAMKVGSLVPPGMKVPDDSLALGVPAKVVRTALSWIWVPSSLMIGTTAMTPS